MKEKVLEAILKLIKPRAIITLIMFITAAYLFILGKKIDPYLSAIISSLMTYYFAEKTIKNNKKEV